MEFKTGTIVFLVVIYYNCNNENEKSHKKL